MTSFALFIVDGTPAGDLVPFGPKIVISPAVCDVNRSYYEKILYQPQHTAYCDGITYDTRKNCFTNY